MPRSGWRKAESDRRLPDLVSVGLLMRVFPADVVDAVIAQCGRTEQRRRSLPARSMAYFAMGMALHSEGSYEDVLALISDGVAWAERDEHSPRLANKAAISHARDRLGPEPMALLFDRVAKPLATEDTPGSWLAGRRLVAVDGTCLDLPDSVANDAFFGRPGVNKGERSAFPQARVVALAECGTHAMFEAVVGAYTASEATLSAQLLGRLQPGMLCLADRGFYSFEAWENACSTGADLLWRVKDNLILEPVEDLPDGSWLAEVFHSTADRRRQHPLRVEPDVRVLQLQETLDQQPRPDEQQQRHGDFGDDQNVAHVLARPARAGTPAFFQRLVQVGLRDLNRGRESEQQARHHRDAQREGDDARVESYLPEQELRDAFGQRGEQRVQTPHREQQPERAARDREHGAFG